MRKDALGILVSILWLFVQDACYKKTCFLFWFALRLVWSFMFIACDHAFTNTKGEPHDQSGAARSEERADAPSAAGSSCLVSSDLA